MTLYKVDIEKSLGTEFWSNRYFVEAETLTAAQGLANQISTAELGVHTDLVVLTKFRVSTAAPGDDVYIVVPINIHGLMGTTGAVPLPLFNVARVDFGVATGRPSRKYLRGGYTEGDINGNVFTSGTIGNLQTYATTLAGLAGLVDESGQDFLFGVVFEKIAMRQLRRGSKQKARPIIP